MRGLSIVDRTVANVPSVRTLIEQNLSQNLHDRLKALFKIREQWSAEEMEPYIEYVPDFAFISLVIYYKFNKFIFICYRLFATPQLSISSILAKHARAITENGQRVYVSKHGN